MFISDTHKIIAFLQEHGYSKDQAEGFVEVVKEFDTTDLATKADIKEVKTLVVESELRVTAKFYVGLLIHGLAVVVAVTAVANVL